MVGEKLGEEGGKGCDDEGGRGGKRRSVIS